MNKNEHTTKKKIVQDLKLNALLEVTKAINNNLSTSKLLDLYQDILENRLGVGKLVLFHFESDWKCILKYGIDADFNHLTFEKELLAISEIETIAFSNGMLSRSFEIVIPVFHKKTPLAYVLLGDVNQEKLELSAAIKHLPYVQTLTNIIIVAIENKKLYKEHIQKAMIGKELELAKDMQKLLFPEKLPNDEHLSVASLYQPHQQVGGDYYDFLALNNHEFIFCIADVSGKGVAAALLMSNIQATLHSLINYTHNLKDIIIELNKRVRESTRGEKFVSLFLGKLNTKSQQLTCINAGHNPPILQLNSDFLELSKGCTLLGIQDSLQQIELDIIDYSGEFILLCYTDGLTDTVNSIGQNFNVDHIKQIIRSSTNQTTEEINANIMNAAMDFKGELDFTDDVALLTIRANDLAF